MTRTRKKRSSRQVFAAWKRSRAAQEIIRDKKREQRWLCVGCMKSLPNEYHISHLVPLVKLDSDDERIFHHNNIVLLCPTCNLKQGSKVDTRFD